MDELVLLGCEVERGVAKVPPGNFDIAVVSPGWPADGPFLAGLRARGREGWQRDASRRSTLTTMVRSGGE